MRLLLLNAIGFAFGRAKIDYIRLKEAAIVGLLVDKGRVTIIQYC